MVRKNKIKQTLISFTLLGIVLFINSINISLVVNATDKFNIALEKGTQIRVINYYNAQAWKAIVGEDSNPYDWFGGKADNVGAKSKTTILGWSKNDRNAYSLFQALMIPKIYLPTFIAIQDYGYNYTYVMSKYNRYYFVWEKDFTFMSFTSAGFSNISDFLELKSPILRYPSNISKLLEDYNDFSNHVNNDTTLQSLGYSLPILNGDDFLWHFILECSTIGSPINTYLKALIENLKCENVSVQGKTLTFHRIGLTNYTAKVTYNFNGNLETFILTNTDQNLIYKITSYYPKNTILIVVGICSASILTITVLFFLIFKRRYRK